MISTLISSVALGMSLLAAHLLWRRVAHSNVYVPLSLFFLANAVAQFCFILREPLVHGSGFTFLPELTLLKLCVELTLPPLFWIYVRELTSEYSRGARKSDVYHFVLPLLPSIALVALSLLLNWPQSEPGLTLFERFLFRFNSLLNIVALMQFCFYIVLVTRRLVLYRRKLQDLFATTSELELRWFRWAFLIIVSSVALELTAEALYAVDKTANPFRPWNDLLRLLLVWFFAVWGLRQRPDLRIEIINTKDEDVRAVKYQKSSITPGQLAEVSLKIKDSIERDYGYRDPNLSLRSLAEKIDVRPNYVSQALNREINASFFDYVNGLRVREAMSLLTETNDTVLAISSEVGFNSRSSFYEAFKKVTGNTPTAYRKANLSN